MMIMIGTKTITIMIIHNNGGSGGMMIRWYW